eukprot:CAMPEP_0206252712 /NCGR_PEP_ID=MMETSP0047_2-20121206/22756_1 /ASSEMBLY_ACC=CAM_ASM_000192 /TAXON_ID=195065 /ORGANISM="Chroomonas mesostigmatica_cf, Strain CCMP1168" /LENGTH=63 /DNA_ID=CAMNT_0053678855 /DNA_START=171 /DNA_END=358 /DNA_ORIENTATION=+
MALRAFASSPLSSSAGRAASSASLLSRRSSVLSPRSECSLTCPMCACASNTPSSDFAGKESAA